MVLGKITLEFTEENGSNRVDCDCDISFKGSGMKERVADHVWLVEQMVRCIDLDNELDLIMLIESLKRNHWPDDWKMKCSYPGDKMADTLYTIMVHLPEDAIIELSKKMESKVKMKGTDFNKDEGKGVN